MKKIMKNKKGFTLIELLAVIVLLAIVGVVGANLIITRLNKGKIDTFVNDYSDIVKEVSAAQIEGMTDCNGSSNTVCSDYIDYATNDIDLTVKMSDGSDTIVTVKANANGTFKKINLEKYYCSDDATTSAGKCKASDETRTKLPKGATLTDKTTITGTFE